jgi:hypothetical protein
MSTDLEECKRLIAEARQDFAHDVDEVVAAIQTFAASVSPAIGEVSAGQALEAVRRVAVATIDRCLDRRWR